MTAPSITTGWPIQANNRTSRGNATTASYTPDTSKFLLAIVGATKNDASSTGISYTNTHTGGTITWTSLAYEYDTNQGTTGPGVQLFRGDMSGSPASGTTNFKLTNSNTATMWICLVQWDNASTTLGGINQTFPNQSGVAASRTVSATAANSIIIGAGVDWTQQTTRTLPGGPTPPAATMGAEFYDVAGGNDFWFEYITAATTGAGSYNVATSSPTIASTAWVMIGAEILLPVASVSDVPWAAIRNMRSHKMRL